VFRRLTAVYKICYMLWRIGDILPMMDQIEWCRESGFDGIGLHASPGKSGVWEGVDPASAGPAERRKFRQALAPFEPIEIHAPFEAVLTSDSLEDTVRRLELVIAFARDIGGRIVTVHAQLPTAGGVSAYRWVEPMAELNAHALDKGIDVGLEIVSGFDIVREWGLSNIGVTLDVGHMYHVDDGKPLEPFGSIGGLVREIDEALVHLHVHDVTAVDHIEVGSGRVDFQDLLMTLHRVDYAKGMCLELNPDRVSPDGIRRSLAWLREKSKECEKL
jgi:sugar phosphate isomerase/epimerase